MFLSPCFAWLWGLLGISPVPRGFLLLDLMFLFLGFLVLMSLLGVDPDDRLEPLWGLVLFHLSMMVYVSCAVCLGWNSLLFAAGCWPGRVHPGAFIQEFLVAVAIFRAASCGYPGPPRGMVVFPFLAFR